LNFPKLKLIKTETVLTFNHLECKGNYATSDNINCYYTGRSWWAVTFGTVRRLGGAAVENVKS